MFELRWVLPAKTATGHLQLQYRYHQPVVDVGGNLCPGDWTEWGNVPTVVADERDPIQEDE
jgi:hypothetical protein